MQSCKKLIFAYIQHYKCLDKVSLNFDAGYSISYNPKTLRLTVKRNAALDRNFWPEAISSMAVIAGQNGTGKTSILRWLLEKTLPCGSTNGLNGIIVIHNGEKLNVYHDVDVIIDKKELEGTDPKVIPHDVSGWKSAELATALAFNPIYYSGHFDSFVGCPEMDEEDNRIWNISDQSLLRHAVDEISDRNSASLSSPTEEFLTSYHVQNDIKICRLLFDSRFQETFSRNDKYILRLPRYIVFLRKEDVGAILKTRIDNLSHSISIKDGKVGVLKKRPKSELRRLKEIERITPNRHMQCLDETEGKVGLSIVLYNAFKNFCFTSYEQNNPFKGFVIDLYLHDYPSSELSTLEWVVWAKEKAISKINQSKGKVSEKECSELLNFFEILEKTINFLNILQWKEGKAFIDCIEVVSSTSSDVSQIYADTVPSIYSSLFDEIHQIERFCYLTYSHVLTEGSSLSSGELAMLNLYSRIKYALNHPMPTEYQDRPFLLILDEAEIGFHPEWQRQFVNKLTQFVSGINKGKRPIQIIYTTHSPITLSDMPKECVNLLRIVNNESVSVPPEEKKETFGANVFELYGDSFFMEHGLIGEFASEKIMQLNSEIDILVNGAEKSSVSEDSRIDVGFSFEESKIQDLRDSIDMIGDERIKTYLHSRLNRVDPNEEIRYLKDRLAFLEAHRNKHHEKD